MRVQGSESGSHGPELDALTTNRSLAMPLLPTLATAAAIALLSLLCRQPAGPEPGRETVAPTLIGSIGDTSFAPAADLPATTAAIPAVIAFGQLYPLAPDGASIAAAARPASARLAAVARRPAKRGETVRSAANPPRALPEPAPLPSRETADQGGEALPEGALPFVPAAATVVERVRAFGSDAVTLGGSVLGALPLIR